MKRKKRDCNQCGVCCTDLMPITEDEAREMSQYASERRIEPQNKNPIQCPFRNNRFRSCAIYDVRPLVCRLYTCSKSIPEMCAELDAHGVPIRPRSIRAAVYGKETNESQQGKTQ